MPRLAPSGPHGRGRDWELRMLDEEYARKGCIRYAQWVANEGCDPLGVFSIPEVLMEQKRVGHVEMYGGAVTVSGLLFNSSIAVADGWTLLHDGRLRCIYEEFFVSGQTKCMFDIEFTKQVNVKERAIKWLENAIP